MLLIVVILDRFLWLIQLLLIAYVIISLVEMFGRMSRGGPRINMGNPFIRFIDDTANAILRPIRRVLEPYQRGMPLDMSVLVAFLLIGLVQAAIWQLVPR